MKVGTIIEVPSLGEVMFIGNCQACEIDDCKNSGLLLFLVNGVSGLEVITSENFPPRYSIVREPPFDIETDDMLAIVSMVFSADSSVTIH